MSTSDVCEQFVKQAPQVVLTRAIVSHLLEREAPLQAVFEEARGRSYEGSITFPALTGAVADIALNQCDNPRQAWHAHQEQLGAKQGAFYGKLNRVEPSISEALVAFSAQQAALLMRACGATPEVVLPGYQCSIIDGNHLTGTQKRLKETRTLGAAALPGQVVAKFNMQTRLFEQAVMIEDAHAQESSALDVLVASLQPRELLIADRHYCIVRFMAQVAGKSCYFVIRQHGRLKGQLLGKRREIGRIETGVVYEQDLQITGTAGDVLVVRRVTLELDQPTRDGEKVIHVLTNLPTADADACRVAELYAQRWQIENAFYVLTTTLTCELKTMGQPRAALFLFATAQLAFNCRAVLLALLRVTHEVSDVKSLSQYLLSLDIARPMPGFLVAVPAPEWEKILPTEVSELAEFLLRVSRHLNLKQYRKSHRGPKKPAPKRQRHKGSTHVATARLLAHRKSSSRSPKM